MLLQSQCLHLCKVLLIPFHLLRNLFCTSLSSFIQHHCFPLDGRSPMRSQTRYHVSSMITFLESHQGRTPWGKMTLQTGCLLLVFSHPLPTHTTANCFCQLSITFYYQIKCSKFTPAAAAAAAKSLQSCPTLATPWTVAHQAPPSMGFSRQKYWSGMPLPSPSLLQLTRVSLLHRLFSSCGEQGLLSSCSAQPSHCGGFSCCSSWALEHRLSSCGTQAQLL